MLATVAAATLVIGLASDARPLGAQQPAATRAATPVVVGTVRDSASGLLVAGAVLQLLDGAGHALTRVLSDERGRWRAVVPPAAARVRVLRIGFRPRELPLAMPPGGAPLDLVLERIPSLLAPVRVAANRRCPARDDRDAALGLLEQVRAGLLATLVAADRPPETLSRLYFQRWFAADADTVTRLDVRREDTTATAASPFQVARDAATFVRDGFVSSDRRGAMFYAPDASTLADDAFAAGYCFRLAHASEGRAGQVGLGFAPPRVRRGRVDLDGVLWVDTVASALRDLEFRYVGVTPTLVALRPGGRLAFDTLPNGAAVVTRWALRLPGHPPSAGPVGRRTGGPLVPFESGGELAMARWADGRVWSGPLATVRLRLTQGDRPAAGVEVELLHTTFRAVADSAGEVLLDALVPGPYELRAHDPTLAPLGLALTTRHRFEAARGDVRVVTLALERAADIAVRRCAAGGTPAPAGAPGRHGRLLARVVDTAGRPVASARWTLWREDAPARDEEPALLTAIAAGAAANDGVLAWCEMPTRQPAVLEVHVDGDAAANAAAAISTAAATGDAGADGAAGGRRVRVALPPTRDIVTVVVPLP